MKKFFSFVAAALVALSMSAEDKVVTFTKADFAGQGTSNTGSEVTATKNGVTFTCDKGYANNYALRCYKNSVVTIKAGENIKGLEFKFDSQNGTEYNGGLEANLAVGATEWTYTMSESQCRFTNINVILGEGEYTPTDPSEPEQPTDPEKPEIPSFDEELSMADAIALCESMADGAVSEKTYRVVGVVTLAYDYSAQYKNQTFYFGADENAQKGATLEAYRAKIVANGAKKGDKVALYGKLNVRMTKAGARSIGFAEACVADILENTAIDNTTIAEKAVKVIENGQLVIIRNGVKFNAVGAVIE